MSAKRVGQGPPHGLTKWRNLSPAVRRAIEAMRVGDPVDLLLDGGTIVRSTVRHPMTTSTGRHKQRSVWVAGVSSSYAAARARPPGGFQHVRGCSYDGAKRCST